MLSNKAVSVFTIAIVVNAASVANKTVSVSRHHIRNHKKITLHDKLVIVCKDKTIVRSYLQRPLSSSSCATANRLLFVDKLTAASEV